MSTSTCRRAHPAFHRGRFVARSFEAARKLEKKYEEYRDSARVPG